MRVKSFFAVWVFMLTVIFFTSCNKENKQSSNTTFAEDNSLAEGIFNDMGGMADEAMANSTPSLKSGDESKIFLSDCVKITLDLDATPHLLAIDFGDTNCMCNDGRYRRGKLLVTFTGPYHESGTIITHKPVDFYVSDNKVEGTQTVTNIGMNENGHIQFDIEASATITKANNGGTITWSSTRQREWIEGSETWNISDDVYQITGTANGTGTTGESWTMEIIDPLRVELDCKWIPSGTIDIKLEGLSNAVLDYGDGQCDRKATLLYNGNTYDIFLRQ